MRHSETKYVKLGGMCSARQWSLESTHDGKNFQDLLLFPSAHRRQGRQVQARKPARTGLGQAKALNEVVARCEAQACKSEDNVSHETDRLCDCTDHVAQFARKFIDERARCGAR
jgi:hypothetical protein